MEKKDANTAELEADFEELREDLVQLMALCDFEMEEDKDAELELSVEVDDPDDKQTMIFMGLQCKVIAKAGNVNTISVKASDLKASMERIFPQITQTEISIACDKLKKEENENQVDAEP